MNEQKPRIREEWHDFRKRVIYSEIKYIEPFPDKDDIRLSFIVVGITLIVLFLIFFPEYWYLVVFAFSSWGKILFILLIILLVLLSFWVQKRERLGLIKERGELRRCKFLDGTLPVNRNSENGYCRLHEQKLEKYPYCIYCRNYERSE